MSAIESVVTAFCKTWNTNPEEYDDFKNETINMLVEVQKHYILASIKNETCGESLHSDIESVMKEFKDIKRMMSKMTVSNIENMENTKNELAEQFKAVAKPRAPASELGPYSSKAAKDFAETNKINPDSIVGTSKHGKITKTDLNKHTKKLSGLVKKSSKASSASGASGLTKEVSKKLCHGTTNSGDVCKSNGKVNIRGEWYCNRHKSQGERCSNLEETDKYSDYESDKDAIESFRKSSIQSLELVDEEDDTNELFDTKSLPDEPKEEKQVGFSDDEVESDYE